jgi:hypothetical protein
MSWLKRLLNHLRETAISKPSRRIVSIRIASCNSPRPET